MPNLATAALTIEQVNAAILIGIALAFHVGYFIFAFVRDIIRERRKAIAAAAEEARRAAKQAEQDRLDAEEASAWDVLVEEDHPALLRLARTYA